MRFRAKGSAIDPASLRANQIVRITSDFKMDVIKEIISPGTQLA